MWMIEGPERNLPPDAFQDRLTHLGGLNRYDEPNFRIWWSQYGYGDGSFRTGGVWSVGEAHFTGYRDMLRGSGEPCWCLGQWNPPELYGTPESYYVSNFDESTGLQLLGEYPYRGRVELLYNLRWHERVGDRIEFRTIPLSTTTFDAIIPIILLAKNVSLEKRRAAYLAAQAEEEREKTDAIERRLRDSALPYTDSVSYTRQGIRSSVIDKKVIELQRAWSDITSRAAALPRGLSTR